MPDFDLNLRPIEQVRYSRLRALHAYWASLRGEEAVPARAAFDPVHIPSLLKHVCLMEVLEGPEERRIRYRVAGTGVTSFTGAEFSGRFVDEVLPARFLRHAMAIYEAAIEERRPVFAETCYHRGGDQGPDPVAMARLLLPLRDESRPVSHLLVGYQYDIAAGRLFPLADLARYDVIDLFAIGTSAELPDNKIRA